MLEADHSIPSCAKVKNEWSYTSTPPHVFMACHGTLLSTEYVFMA